MRVIVSTVVVVSGTACSRVAAFRMPGAAAPMRKPTKASTEAINENLGARASGKPTQTTLPLVLR